MTSRVFCDTSLLIRYFAEDDIPRALAAATLIDSDVTLVVSTGVVLETIYVLDKSHSISNPELSELLARFLTRANVELADADRDATVAAILSTGRVSARRIPDAILAAAAQHAGCDIIASFDAKFVSPSVPVRLL